MAKKSPARKAQRGKSRPKIDEKLLAVLMDSNAAASAASGGVSWQEHPLVIGTMLDQWSEAGIRRAWIRNDRKLLDQTRREALYAAWDVFPGREQMDAAILAAASGKPKP